MSDNILEQVPIQILTGFLGSGKTTMLNKVINNPVMKGTVLLINEVGEIGIDQKLISTDNPVVLLDSGCICCSLQDGLIQVLQYLTEVREEGNFPLIELLLKLPVLQILLLLLACSLMTWTSAMHTHLLALSRSLMASMARKNWQKIMKLLSK